jgi:hypothetical protein
MAKHLSDILRGSNKSKTVPGSTGKDPGVDYAPKAPDDRKFVAKHATVKHDFTGGNDDAVYDGSNVQRKPNRETNKGYDRPEDEKVYGIQGEAVVPVKKKSEGSSKPHPDEVVYEGSLDELSVDTMRRYVSKRGGPSSKDPKVQGAVKKITAAKFKADAPKHRKVVDEGALDELSRWAVDKYRKGSSIQVGIDKNARDSRNLTKRGRGIDLANKKLNGRAKVPATEETQIDEISASTANNFYKTAMDQASGLLKAGGKLSTGAGLDQFKRALIKKGAQRMDSALLAKAKVDGSKYNGKYPVPASEEAACNHTPKGKPCPVHGMAECSGGKVVLKEKPPISETLDKSATAGDWIHDFVHSKNPRFSGKSAAERKKQALAAYYAKQRNEETINEDGYGGAGGPDLAQPLLGEYDPTHDQTRAELKAIANKAAHIHLLGSKKLHTNWNLKDKITAARRALNDVHDHMCYSDNERVNRQMEDEGMDPSEGSGGMSSLTPSPQPANTFPDYNNRTTNGVGVDV